MASRTRSTGIEVRHSRRCASAGGARCTCTPTYRAQVFSRRENRTVRKTFKSRAEAKAWRTDAQVALRRGTLTGARTGTLSDDARLLASDLARHSADDLAAAADVEVRPAQPGCSAFAVRFP